MNGFVIVDKPKGITSHDVVYKIRKISGQDKVGHCGTLDPIATGVLVVALGEATKLVEYFLGCDKVYEAHAVLGAVSDTYDVEGKIDRVTDKEVSKDKINEVLQVNFIGVIDQVPPKYSAVKIDGKRAYDLARAGEEFSIKSKKIRIDSINILDYKWPDLKMDVHCGSGTYIRSLIHDMGQKLKCGAYMKDLRRMRVSRFDISDAYTIPELEKDFASHLVSMSEAVSHLGRVILDDAEYNRLKDGGIIQNKHGKMTGVVFAYYKGEVAGILEFPENGRLLKFHKKLNIS